MSKSHLRFLLAGVLAAAVLAATGAAASADRTPDPVIEWNQALIGILNTPGAQPATIHATRSLAILHAAIYAGQHFRTDEDAGQKLGAQVAVYVLARVMLPVHH